MNIKKNLTIAFVLIVTKCVTAQQGAVSSGGNGTGTGGSFSFSIGLVDYINASSGNAVITQGNQQPFELYTNSVKRLESNFKINTYPNPSSGLITLEIGNYENQQLSFEVFDIQGKKLFEEKITANKTEINIQDCTSGMYLMNIKNENNQIIQTIKVIKH